MADPSSCAQRAEETSPRPTRESDDVISAPAESKAPEATVRWSSTAADLAQVPLGEILEFRVEADAGTENRFYLKHQGIFYTRPFRDWSREDTFLVYPEAPGTYVLRLEWRTAAGHGGYEDLTFHVVTSGKGGFSPHRTRVGGANLWFPSEWEARATRSSEEVSLRRLAEHVRPGMVAYDVGANLGLYATEFARLVGEDGRVYCFEANPICVHLLRASLVGEGLGNVDIFPVAVLDREGETAFNINYGNSNIGISELSGFYSAKPGHQVRVPCAPLDTLIARYRLRPPDVVKIDIEGAEQLAVEGLRGTLAGHRPIFFLELHHDSCTRATLAQLDPLGYRYRDPRTGDDLADVEGVCQRFAGQVFQLLALPAAGS